MSLRRQLFVLIAFAFLGTCALLQRWNASSSVPHDEVQQISVAPLVEGISSLPLPTLTAVPAQSKIPIQSSAPVSSIALIPPPARFTTSDAEDSFEDATANEEARSPADSPPFRLPKRVGEFETNKWLPKNAAQKRTKHNNDVRQSSDRNPASLSDARLTSADSQSYPVRPTQSLPTSISRQSPESPASQLASSPDREQKNPEPLLEKQKQPDRIFTSELAPPVPTENLGLALNSRSDNSKPVHSSQTSNEIRNANLENFELERNPLATSASLLEPASAYAMGIKPSAHASSQGISLPAVLQNSQNFVLAAQPEFGAHWKNEIPVTDQIASTIAPIVDDFSPGPQYDCQLYEPYEQQHIYEGKTLNATQRPLLEIGRPWYQLGQLSPSSNVLGKYNPLDQQFILFGDFRTGFASNTQSSDSSTLTGTQLNLNFDWKLTSTERLHMFASPLTKGIDSTGYLFDEERVLDNTNADVLFGFFEGDVGAMAGGLTNQTYPFDLPFTVGVIPLLFQNGIWMESQVLGFAFTIPSRNSARFDISNMDITFFAGYDKLTTDALPGDDSAGKIYGIATFIEALNGYVEADYAFIEDRTFFDRSYHNLGIGYTRRFGQLLSNSTRAIFNLGQRPDGVDQTADGVLLLSENSLITSAPSTVVPYFNMFAGFDRPQSAARAAQAGGVLRNTGILFESDNLTNYPTLDSTANDTYGAALGLNLLANDFSQQLVVETAFLGTMGSDLGRNAVGNQYGLGARYQLPLSNALILRADAMYGFLESTQNIHGVRVELRHKF